MAWNCSSLLCVWEGSFISKASSALVFKKQRMKYGRGEQTLGYRQHPPLYHAGPLSHGGSPPFRKQGRVCGGAQGGRALSSFITRTCLIWRNAFLISCSAHESSLMKLRRLDSFFHSSRSQFLLCGKKKCQPCEDCF